VSLPRDLSAMQARRMRSGRFPASAGAFRELLSKACKSNRRIKGAEKSETEDDTQMWFRRSCEPQLLVRVKLIGLLLWFERRPERTST